MPHRPEEERQSRLFKQTASYRRGIQSLGARVRQLRQERDWTLEAAAERMHIDPQHLQKIELGKLNVTMVTLARMADGLAVPLEGLFASKHRRRGVLPGDAFSRNESEPRSSESGSKRLEPPKSAADHLLRDVGRRLGEERVKQGWTQERLGKAARLPPGAMKRIELGRQRTVTVLLLAKLSIALDMVPRSLFEPPKRSRARRGRPAKVLKSEP